MLRYFVPLAVCLFAVSRISNAQITLAQETGNNTSGCTIDSQHPYCSSAFTALEDYNDIHDNGDPIETPYLDAAPGHVTSVSLSSTVAPTLMYSGFDGRFICVYQAWFGLASHIDVGYNETNSATTNAQASAMNRAGCNIALVSFYGTTEFANYPDYQFEETATNTLFASVEQAGPLKIGILEVDSAFSGLNMTNDGSNGKTGNCNQFGTTDYQDTITCIEGAMGADLAYINTTYVAPGNYYWTDGGKPVVAFFGWPCDFPAISEGDTGSCPGSNATARWNQIWADIQADFPSFKYVFEYGSYSIPQTSNGEFAWPQPATWDGQPGNISDGSQYFWCANYESGCGPGEYLYEFYDQGADDPQELSIGALYKGFDDSYASWGKKPFRIISQQCGGVLLLTAGEPSTNAFFGSGNQIPYMQVATWNDYEEGTEVETGISNCLSYSSINVSQGTLYWSLSSSDQYGYPIGTSTIHHYTLWYAVEGDPSQTLHQVATGIPGNATSLSLSGLPFPTPKPDNLNLYLEMVGMPLFLNVMSPAVAF